MSARADQPETSDTELLARMSRGDATAFTEFYDRHAAVLYSLAMRILNDAHEAEEALQEAALLLWQRARSYDSSLGRPLSWAIAVTRNKAIDRLRAGQRKTRLAIDLAQAVALHTLENNSSARIQTITNEKGALMRNAIVALPMEQRQAIELAFFGGLSHAEIAAQLSQPLGTIKARIRRGMLALRDALEDRL